VITLTEILRGIQGSKRLSVKTALEDAFNVVQISNEVILEYCRLYEELKTRGLIMSDADLLIAATAKANRLTLKTADKSFEKLREFDVDIEIV
jgi:predicted nucleic acid-binding protein